nr:conjugal transfer protein TraC [Alphaproteobacteria bacterium]
MSSEHQIRETEYCNGPSSATLRLANEFLSSYSLSEILPYRSFEPETQLFMNRSSVGFVIETLPLVGCGEDIPRQLTGLFQHAFPLGSNFQCLLLASSRIGVSLNTWENARSGHPLNGTSEVLEELAKERIAHMKQLAMGRGVRTFRLILSYSEPSHLVQSFEDILALREQILTTLKGWGLPVKVWHAEDLLSGLDELLNPSQILESPNIPWNIHDSLSHQLMSPETRWLLEPSQMVFGESEKVMRLYTTRVLPGVWHLNAMGILIGDPFDEFLRMQSGFFISYGVHIAHEKMLKTQMLAKCGNVEKQ